MSPLARRAGAAASVVLALGLLAACSDPGTGSPGDGFTLTPNPSKSADAGALPSGAALTTWADTALPANRVGGSTAVVRTSGEVAPGADAVIDLAQPDGQWQLTIVCQSADGSAMTMTATPVDTSALQPLKCGAPGGAARGDLGDITFAGGSGHTFTLRTTVPAVFVYEISPQTAPLD